MLKHLLAAGATLALILLARGMSAPASAAANPSLTCVNPRAAHKAYLVIQHSTGVVQKCVGFDADQLGGGELMRQSGVVYVTQQFGVGTAVCSIDGEPAQYTECFPQHGPWWSLWVSTGGGGWVRADSGYFHITLKPGDAMGWRYASREAPPPLPGQ